VFKLKKMTFATPAVLTGSSPATQLEHQHEARGHQFPLRVVFVPEVFTPANGLRNANFKLMWTKVRVRASTARTCPR
jgi:hypothetical protein